MTLFLALLAGALTTLSPCVLPVIPVVLVGALQRHRLAPLALVVGMAAMFTLAGTALASTALAGPRALLRDVSALLLLAFGIVLASARMQGFLARAAAPIAARLGSATSRFEPDGLGGFALLGMLLGIVWTPCSGPTLGAAMALAAASEDLARVTLVMLVFSIGAGLPMLALAYGSRRALAARRDRLARVVARSKPLLGYVLLALGAAILFDLDRAAETWVVARMPEWLLVLATRL